MDLGLYSFVDNMAADPGTSAMPPQQRIRNLLEEVELADQVGLDVFAIGEHHRVDYLASAPAILLAAAATRTKHIRLSSAVTVLSSEEPVRVFQQYASLDLVSGGRAEIIAGRGSFIESYPLFGYDLDDYETLFSEKLDLLLRLRDSETVSWPGGRHTRPIDRLGVYPRPVQNPLPVWIGVGGTPQSVVRAGTLGLPMALAIIGGEPQRFAPLVDLYRKAATQTGQEAARLRVGINAHGLIGENATETVDLAFESSQIGMAKIARERGWSPSTRAQFDAGVSLRGAYVVGSPNQVIDKILQQHEWFKHDRFLLQMSVGPVPHDKMLKAIELYGTVVAPAIRKALGPQAPAAQPSGAPERA